MDRTKIKSNPGFDSFIRHPAPAGKRADSRDQHRNERAAFERLIASREFQNWHRVECARRLGQAVPETPEQILNRIDRMIEEGLRDGTILVEEISGEVCA